MAPTNQDRVNDARLLIDLHQKINGDDQLDCVVTDVITNLRHYCKAEGLDFDKCVELSEVHFNAEENLEQQAEEDYQPTGEEVESSGDP